MTRRGIIGRPAFARTSAGLSNSSFAGLPANFTFRIPMYVPTDAKWVQIEYGNSFIGYPAGANFPDITPAQVGAYKSDGTGVPTGSIIPGSKQTGITAPGDGEAPYVSPKFDVTGNRGTDGRIVVCYTAPSGSTVGLAQMQQWGEQSAAGASVDPLPGGFGAMTNIIATVRLRIHGSKRPRVVTVGNSIVAAYNSDRGLSAWYAIGESNDWICDVIGIPLATMLQWSEPTGGLDPRPYFWEGAFVGGAEVGIIEGGANDLWSTGATLTDLQNRVAAIALLMRQRGVRRILLQTISPGVTWLAQNATRVAFNTWALGGGIANIDDTYDLDADVADPGTPTQLLPAYTGDGDHLNAAGFAAVEPNLTTKIAGLL